MNKEAEEQQFCPACKKQVVYSSRYPDYACSECIAKAVDENGASISFFNETIMGYGCQGRLNETNTYTSSNTCFINGMKFNAYEAYFGGIIILPAIQ